MIFNQRGLSRTQKGRWQGWGPSSEAEHLPSMNEVYKGEVWVWHQVPQRIKSCWYTIDRSNESYFLKSDWEEILSSSSRRGSHILAGSFSQICRFFQIAKQLSRRLTLNTENPSLSASVEGDSHKPRVTEFNNMEPSFLCSRLGSFLPYPASPPFHRLQSPPWSLGIWRGHWLLSSFLKAKCAV